MRRAVDVGRSLQLQSKFTLHKIRYCVTDAAEKHLVVAPVDEIIHVAHVCHFIFAARHAKIAKTILRSSFLIDS